MVYVDQMGQWEMLELGNEMMLVPLKIREWPEDDVEFLGLAHIKGWEKEDGETDGG